MRNLAIFLTLFIFSSCDFTVPKDLEQICENPTVIDGDTIRCTNLEKSVRIIPSINNPSMWFDAPETSSRFAECDSEILLGLRSKRYIEEMFSQNSKVVLKSGINDRDHFNRNLRQVELHFKSGKILNIAHGLRQSGLGYIYHKSKHPISWCKGVSSGIK